MQIDFTQAITAESKAQAAAITRATEVKTACRARILSVGSEATQMNIAQAGIVFTAVLLDGMPRADALTASGLREGDLTLAQGWKAWVAAMQTECRRAIETGTDPIWPDLPQGVAKLAARF